MNTDFLLSMGVGAMISVGLILYLYLQKELINEVFREKLRDIKEESKRRRDLKSFTQSDTDSDLERTLNSLLSRVSHNVVKAEKLSKVTGQKIGVTTKIQKGIVTTITNPYNNTNALKIFIMVVFFCGFGAMASTILANPAVGIGTIVMGLIMPFTLAILGGLRNKLRVMKGNLHMVSVHLPNYLDSSTFEESLRRTLKSLDTNSRQYKALDKCLKNMIELNMTLHNSLEVLKEDILADKFIIDYFIMVEKAETVSKNYKNILSTIIRNFEGLVINNDMVVNFAYWLYILYIMAVFGMIFVIGILKSTDKESYIILSTSIGGQAATLLVFATATIIGLVLSFAADLIVLDITDNKEEDILKEDIYD